MAIDTATKRRMVAGVPFGTGVTPDSVKGVTWRFSVAGSYYPSNIDVLHLIARYDSNFALIARYDASLALIAQADTSLNLSGRADTNLNLAGRNDTNIDLSGRY